MTQIVFPHCRMPVVVLKTRKLALNIFQLSVEVLEGQLGAVFPQGFGS